LYTGEELWDRKGTLSAPKARPAKKARHTVSPSVSPYSLGDRAALAARYPDAISWLADMKDYLDVKQGLSVYNSRNVMRQVEKLVAGTGVWYEHWDDHMCFGKGQRVDLSWDFEELLVHAQDFEDEHGKDWGNGWLLRHPIKKLISFQQHLLEEETKSNETS
jgi:hypothetical protein